MEQVEMTGQMRTDELGQGLRTLRESGYIPAVVYGANMAPLAISVPEKWFRKATAKGRSLVSLRLEGERFDAMVQAVQRDPVNRRITHVDFYRVDLSQTMDVRIPIHVYGIDMVERRNGIVQQQTREIEVIGRPTDTPEFISVDVAHLKPGDHIVARELSLPPQVRLKSDPEEVLVSILAPKQTVAFAEAEQSESV